MTSAVFQRRRQRWAKAKVQCWFWLWRLNVTSPYTDIKTEDGLSHSPGQTGLLGYSNFSGTPPSQSLYSYSHTHGQSYTPHTSGRTCTHTHLAHAGFDFSLAGRSIHLLLSSFLFSSSRPLSLRHTCSPLVAVWTSGVKRLPLPSALLGVRPAFSAQTSAATP